MRVIIADADADVRSALAERLRPDFEVVGAVAGGCDVLEALGVANPEAIVLDLPSGSIDAWTFRREWKGLAAAGVPVILMTSHPLTVGRAAGKMGAAAVVSKECTTESLIATILGLLRSYSGTRARGKLHARDGSAKARVGGRPVASEPALVNPSAHDTMLFDGCAPARAP